MDPEEAAPNIFDELIDRSLRGEEIDLDAVLAGHPELSSAERRQLRTLCGQSKPRTAEGPAPGIRSSAPEAALPLSRVGGHRLLRRIGSGAMGAVFLGEDEALGRQVAIKLLGPDILGTGERADRFLRETRAAARLRHPNIVTVHSAGEEAGVRYMVMELIPGSSLAEVMAAAAAKGSRTPIAQVLQWGVEMARALQTAHEAGIVHRDVKPSNIRIADDGRAVLLDFGLARDAGDSTLTETGSFRGSPQYASPEQVDADARTLDARTDVYSLGATLYEVLTGVAPFRGETREQLFHNILTRDPVPLRRLEPSIPKDLETVVLAALEKNPARRHPSAAALAADLEAVSEGRPVSVRPPSAFGRLARWARRHPARAGLAAAIVVAVPAIAGLGGFIAANMGKIKQAESADRELALSRMLERGFLDMSEDGDVASQAVFEQAMRFAPGSAEAKAGFALSRIAQRDPEGALAFLGQLPEAMRESNWCGRIRLTALTELRRAEEAREVARTMGKPATSLDEFVTGFIFVHEAHLGKDVLAPAIEHLRMAIFLSERAVAIYHYELGHALWHARRNEEAKQIARTIESLWPNSPDCSFAVGRTLREADPVASAAALEKAAHPPPDSLTQRHFISLALSEIGDDRQKKFALDFARETLSLDKSNRFSHFVVGSAALANQDPGLALPAFRMALQFTPSVTTKWPFTQVCFLKMAKAFEDNGDPEGAILVYRQLLRVAPRSPRWLNALGIRLVARGEIDEAIRCFEEEVKIDANDAEALCNLGRSLQMRGELSRGLEALKKGHEIGSQRPNWKYPSAKWVRDAEAQVELAELLDDSRPESAQSRVTK